LSQGRGWKSQCRARSRSTRVFPDHRGLHAVVENLARCSRRSPRTQRRGSAKLTAGPDGRQTAPDQARIAKHQALERVRKAASSKQQAASSKQQAASSKQKEEEEVHRALPSHQKRRQMNGAPRGSPISTMACSTGLAATKQCCGGKRCRC
jgi:pyruvate/2-oxoglutarate dehydrogenase complex dihydrolipoamide acyltransferase (E2) component